MLKTEFFTVYCGPSRRVSTGGPDGFRAKVGWAIQALVSHLSVVLTVSLNHDHRRLRLTGWLQLMIIVDHEISNEEEIS